MGEGRVRAAIVGGAGMWGKHYLKAAAEHERVDAVLVDTSPRRAEFAETYGVEEVCESLDELLERETPDVVCNILPVGIAHQFVVRCAEAGVKVISCEKPIAVDLATADRMVEACRANGAAFGCGTAHWEIPHFHDTAAWIADGNIGQLTGAAIPGGLPVEVSGAGCVQLTMLRGLTGCDVEWVEGWTLPPVEGYNHPDADDLTMDVPAYGRLGLTGGVVCEIPPPRMEQHIRCRVAVRGTEGQVYAQGPANVYLQGSGAETTPVFPEFLQAEGEGWRGIAQRFESLIEALDAGDGQVPCSGHDYRQALEIAIAFKLSAANGHERVELPLKSRDHRILPHPYRALGGDVAGYESIGYEGPPEAERRTQRTARS